MVKLLKPKDGKIKEFVLKRENSFARLTDLKTHVVKRIVV